MSSASAAETAVGQPYYFDFSPYIQDGLGDRAIHAAQQLAGLWREEIIWVETMEDWGPAHRGSYTDLTALEQQIIYTNRQVRNERLAANVRATPLAERILLGSRRYQAAARDKYSIDRDEANNYHAYLLDRLAFLAAWFSVHPPEGVK